VVQLDLFSSKVLFVCASQAAAATAVGSHLGGIAKCCKGPGASAAGFKWRYATDEEAAKAIQGAPPKPRPKGPGSQKIQIAQIDPISGSVVCVYKSMSAAARALAGNNSSGISRCCGKKQSSCYGFYWRLATGNEIENAPRTWLRFSNKHCLYRMPFYLYLSATSCYSTVHYIATAPIMALRY
jgi:hypothetical protein